MLRKMVCAMIVMTVSFSFVMADDFFATITKVEGDKVTYQKYQKTKKGEEKKKDGDAVTIDAAGAKVAKMSFNKETKKVEAGDAIEGGLKAEVFAKIGEKGLAARITTSDDNKKITQILVPGGKKK